MTVWWRRGTRARRSYARSNTTAEDIARVGTKDERPIDLYWVGFTDGSSGYSVTLQGQPGTVSEEQVLKIASAYYERVAGN